MMQRMADPQQHPTCSGDRITNVQITFNGVPREIAPQTSVATLLGQLDMIPKYVAVEVNLELVPRSKHAEHLLEDGDRLEVVTLVGGG